MADFSGITTMSMIAPVQQLWQRASKREQRLLSLAAAVVVVGLIWWVGMAPALKVIKAAPAQHLAPEAPRLARSRRQPTG